MWGSCFGANEMSAISAFVIAVAPVLGEEIDLGEARMRDRGQRNTLVPEVTARIAPSVRTLQPNRILKAARAGAFLLLGLLIYRHREYGFGISRPASMAMNV
jgi:hypothetical protein